MDSKTLRKKFLDFFEKNDHVIIPSASLVPAEEEQLAGKERVLFTSAGMQPLIPYLMGKPHPQGKKLANVQKCLRTDDIEQIGDALHHTFFEMLGNWSLGDYWKDEAIRLSFEFLTKELEIPIEKLAISIFAGDKDAPKDEESAKAWESLGIPKDRIFYFGKEHNWWPTGEKSGPCGPDTEMFIWTGQGDAPEKFDPEDKNWVEVWNDVFMEFNRKSDGTLEELPQKNVDTGLGLERMLAVLNGKDNDYETDLFSGARRILEEVDVVNSHESKVGIRIVLDHIRAAIFMIDSGIEPSNKEQGYILRRLIRRAALHARIANINLLQEGALILMVNEFIKVCADFYPSVLKNKGSINNVLDEELNRFERTLEIGMKKILSRKSDIPISGSEAFDFYQTYGFPPELIKEFADIDMKGFEEAMKHHQELSRTASAAIFKGGLADHSEIVTKYHTATHLLHQALRDILGPTVFQQGSNITAERLRFDFSYDKKMTDEEVKQAEDIINQRIKEDLKVDNKIVSLDEAKEMNAIGLFDEKYADKVSIYGVGPNYQLDPKAKDTRVRGGYYSLEFCGGPHVENTGVIGKIKITKEEAVSSGIRRIRALIE